MSVNGLLNNVQGIGNSTQSAVDVLGRQQTGTFFAQLKPASYRGVQFGVLSGSLRFGRRNAIHEYPFRDTPWVEDMGRAARRFTIVGFLVGDDVIAQRARLLAKAETKASADGDEFVHPTGGTYKVALLDFTCVEKWNEGRYFEVTFSFMEQGQRQFPARATSGRSEVTSTAALTNAAAARAFAEKTVAALRTGATAANAAVKQAAAWAKVAQQSSRDVTSLVNLAASLPGEFGRLLGQASSIKIGQIVPVVAGTTQQSLRGQAAVSRQKVDAASATLADASTALGPVTTDGYAAAAQALTEAVRLGSATPADAVRALTALATYAAPFSEAGPAATVRDEAAILLRRAAAVSLARAGADFQPASSDDAVAVRDAVLGVLADRLTEAGDRGDDEAYLQLRALSAGAASDLNVRGANLPDLQTVNTAVGLPALVLACRLYGDVSRADDLVRRARPVHPAFMPRTFRALTT